MLRDMIGISEKVAARAVSLVTARLLPEKEVKPDMMKMCLGNDDECFQIATKPSSMILKSEERMNEIRSADLR